MLAVRIVSSSPALTFASWIAKRRCVYCKAKEPLYTPKSETWHRPSISQSRGVIQELQHPPQQLARNWAAQSDSTAHGSESSGSSGSSTSACNPRGVTLGTCENLNSINFQTSSGCLPASPQVQAGLQPFRFNRVRKTHQLAIRLLQCPTPAVPGKPASGAFHPNETAKLANPQPRLSQTFRFQ